MNYSSNSKIWEQRAFRMIGFIYFLVSFTASWVWFNQHEIFKAYILFVLTIIIFIWLYCWMMEKSKKALERDKKSFLVDGGAVSTKMYSVKYSKTQFHSSEQKIVAKGMTDLISWINSGPVGDFVLDQVTSISEIEGE